MWIACLLVGLLLGFLAGFVHVTYIVYHVNKRAIETGIIKLNGKFFTLNKIDL